MRLSETALEALAEADYARVAGTEIQSQDIYGYDARSNGQELYDREQPFRLVVRTDVAKESLHHWCDEWLDPYWDVEPAPGETRLGHYTSLWVYGTSYSLDGEKYETPGLVYCK